MWEASLHVALRSVQSHFGVELGDHIERASISPVNSLLL